MKRVIRQNIFETNSSSMHSFTIGKKRDEKLVPYADGFIYLETGDYGWEIEDYYDPRDRASYVLTYAVSTDNIERFEKLDDAFCKHIPNCTGIKINFTPCCKKITQQEFISESICPHCESDLYGNKGYIDHQSTEDGQLDVIFESTDTLIDFIFSSDSTLHTDNDNH